MRVLVFQHFHPGHHYQFLQHLLPGILDLQHEVVVAVTEEGLRSSEFARFLEPFSSRVGFEPSLPPWRDRLLRNQWVRLSADLRTAVRRHAADYVLVPSGDSHVAALGLLRSASLGGPRAGCPGEVGIHWGQGLAASNAREWTRDVVHRAKLAWAGWDRVHVANVLFWEAIQKAGGRLADAAAVMPFPVEHRPGRFRQESRRALGLPEDGRLIGIVGVIDYRKAVLELLSAFRTATHEPTDRVLLAGSIEPALKDRVARSFGDLIECGRVLLLDRFLETESYQYAISALDVVCPVYRDLSPASMVLLQSVAASRPVLVSRFGWNEAMVSRFGLGWSADVRSPSAFSRVVATALDGCRGHRRTVGADRLVAFHSPENFRAAWTARLRAFGGGQLEPVPLTWSWVSEAGEAVG